ncbi:bifunctional DNA-formamidopyrimidine glycosylase/DNA-(apurinic or apyrimidinic site) lyase [Usitatibacter rugosus]|nr:bifunctional DNA-formamidopyrimidine glycosylase/DNA-(apurinic or apyrimidinic site) lyase [Usitatibacter rugosus]
MPELPEVETTRRGLVPRMVGRTIQDVVVRDARLRWPVPRDLARRLRGAEVVAIRRRGKYLLFDFPKGHLLVHLGMSGRLTMVPEDRPAKLHDHVDVRLDSHESLRLNDPRRFGAMLWIGGEAEKHALLRGLGVEPFDPAFTGAHLHALARGRRVAVKHFIMNASVVTGVGNIYASEALFRAGIHPTRPVGRISLERWNVLAQAIRDTLSRALDAGGSTLRDYVSATGEPGQFQNVTSVYDREGQPCRRCSRPIKALRQGQRSTFYCAGCQR